MHFDVPTGIWKRGFLTSRNRGRIDALTIAACYLSAEGVVFGADSTTTMHVRNPVPNTGSVEHHYNFAQKIFQIGDHSTLGITMWGLGNLSKTSYRTLVARFSDQLQQCPESTMADIAALWNELFWTAYSSEYPDILARARHLSLLPTRTPEESGELDMLEQSFSGGFCLGGWRLPDRAPQAFKITYGPTQTTPTAPAPLSLGSAKFWGCPNLINRLIYGVDFGVLAAIIQSDKWTGTDEDLLALVSPYRLAQPFDLPIREAIDWVHSSIYTTIQAMKFSHLAPVCGGPVEIAVITTDRQFRWVRHKRMDAPLRHGGLIDG